MINYRADIERFLSHFKSEVEQIWEFRIEGGGNEKAYKKVLFFSVIDSLSKCIFPRRGNRDRIVSFVVEFAEWEYRNRISLPHLSQLLHKSPEPAFSGLRKFVIDEYSKWSSGEIIRLERDPDIKDVMRFWPGEKEHKKPLAGISIESLQHIHLFYSYRNFLVHELREPGYGFESYREDSPYYLSFSHLPADGAEDEKETWELVYPVLFLKNLLCNCLKNMEIYLNDNNIDPYQSYTFGTYWIDELNR
jgi:hypothetical protein